VVGVSSRLVVPCHGAVHEYKVRRGIFPKSVEFKREVASDREGASFTEGSIFKR
jgi:hypothetical protein